MTKEQLSGLKSGDRIYNIGIRYLTNGDMAAAISEITYHFSHHGIDKVPSMVSGILSIPVAFLDRGNCGHTGRYKFPHTILLDERLSGWAVEDDLQGAIARILEGSSPLIRQSKTTVKTMDNEVLKATVLAKGKEIAPIYCTRYEIAPYVSIESHVDHNGFSIYRNWTHSEKVFEVCRVRIELPAYSAEWWIAAKLLEIPTEMPIELMEAPMAIAQHYHELREAHDAGFTHYQGITMTIDQSWERFIGDYGKEEIKRTGQRAVEATDNLKESLSKLAQPPAFVFLPPDEWEVCPDCKGYSVVPGPCFTCGRNNTAFWEDLGKKFGDEIVSNILTAQTQGTRIQFVDSIAIAISKQLSPTK